MVRMKSKKGKETIIFAIIGLIGIILVIVGVIILWRGKKKLTRQRTELQK